MASARHYLAWQSRLITPELGQRVVEVGCGLGNFTEKLLDRQAVIALDIEPDCIERLNRRYPRQHNLHTFVDDTSSESFTDLARFRPDSCLCVNVLEHIEDDREALVRMASILEPRGVIVLWVPAFPSLYGGVDRNLGHFRRYRRASIARLAASAGLALQKAHYANLAGFFAWWFNAHILRREALSQMQIDLFDRFIAPLSSRLEKIPPPFGQSILAVLRKP
ncbi:MAG: class I SAM-dependent methyltransferase [Bryobacteraceae bacterium]|jgi:2-polyprenyl-3-methyl-5-hydroxy-6-metoxy-1,4-benzoquinol methylase